MSKKFIAIAGNVGVGKSTLTEKLAAHFGWTPFFEAVDDNPYLADFYHDMKTWSFHSQIFFLSRRLRHHKDLIRHPNHVVQDRTVYEDAEIFAANLYQQGNMHTRDYRSYRELYEVMVELLPPPSLMVYLKASVPTLLRRIAKRGREFEQDIDPNYLERLNGLYDAWIDNFTLCPVLTLNADRLNFVQSADDFGKIAAEIGERLQQSTDSH